MRKQYARKFWKRYLGLVSNGGASMNIENPAIQFAIRTKSGEYDALPDDEYNKRYADIEELQTFWGAEKMRAAGDILIDALARTDISGDLLSGILDLLADGSARTNYLPEKTSSPDGEGSHRCSVREMRTIEHDWTPRAIYDKINKRVRGQPEAARAAALVVYNMLEGRRSNTVFCGPTGCGKSEIWRCLARLFQGRIRVIDASRLTADGWKGSMHVRDIFEGIDAEVRSSGMIAVLDEADKVCCETIKGTGNTDYSAMIQNSLLKLLDGDTIEFGMEDNRPAFSVDCSRVSVVPLGAFESLLAGKSNHSSGGIGFGAAARVICDYGNTEINHADLIEAGMRREIAGRINRIVQLRPLTIDDYRAILAGPVMRDLQAATKGKIEIDDETVDYLAERAQATGLGVRWAKSQIGNIIDDLVFENPKSEKYTVQIPASGRSDQQRCTEQSVCAPMPGP